MNCKTFSNLQFRSLLKKVSHSIHIDLSNMTGENHFSYLSVWLVLFDVQKGLQQSFLN